MKRVFMAAAIAACAWSESAAAQARAGLHVGLSTSALSMDSSGDSGFRRGLIAGGWVRFPLVSAVGIQLGAYYTEKGSSDSVQGVTAGIELKYLEFPVMLAFVFNRTAAVSGYFSAGGALGVDRGCRISVRSQDVSSSVDCDATDDEVLVFSSQQFDIGLVLGGGIEFNQGPILLTVDLRANFGLTDALFVHTADPGRLGLRNTDHGENVSLSLLAGVAFPLGRVR